MQTSNKDNKVEGRGLQLCCLGNIIVIPYWLYVHIFPLEYNFVFFYVQTQTNVSRWTNGKEQKDLLADHANDETIIKMSVKTKNNCTSTTTTAAVSDWTLLRTAWWSDDAALSLNQVRNYEENRTSFKETWKPGSTRGNHDIWKSKISFKS